MPQPEIALTLGRCVATCQAGAEFAAIVQLPVGRLVAAVCDSLGVRVGTPARTVALDAILSHVRQVLDNSADALLAGLPKRKSLARAKLLKQLRIDLATGQLAETLATAWDTHEVADQSRQGLEDLVAHLFDDGIDSERLVSAVIVHESNRHTRLVWNEANKLSSNLPGTSAADLLTFGWLGLRVALRQFDPSLGFQFSTFGVPKINGAMRDGVRSEHWLPKRLTTFVRKVTAADEELANKLGRSPTLPELAEHLGEDFEQLKIIPRLANSASFEELALVNGGERDEISALCDATSDPADMALAAARNEAVRSAVERLPDEEAEVARLLWLEEFSPAEVRELCGLNARQFRARRDRAQEHLVSALAEWRSVAS